MVTQQIAMAVGTSGAYVDISAYVAGPEGVSYQWGRRNEFQDPQPGIIRFTVENQDGRFTPGNTASAWVTPPVEGTGVVWNWNGRLLQFQISGFELPSGATNYGRITIVAADQTQIAARTQLTTFADSIVRQAEPYYYWPMTDASGSTLIAEASGGPYLTPQGATVAYAQAATGPAEDQQVLISASTGEQFLIPSLRGQYMNTSAAAGVIGTWSFWYTNPVGSTGFFGVYNNPGVASPWSWEFYIDGTDFQLSAPCVGAAGTFSLGTMPLTSGVAAYVTVQMSYTATTATTRVYINGTLWATDIETGLSNGTPAAGPLQFLTLFRVSPPYPSTAARSTYISHLSWSSDPIHEEYAFPTTAALRFPQLTSLVPGMTTGSVDSALSGATLTTPATSGQTAWTALSDLLRSEQGHLYQSCTGTLTAPVSVWNLRSRARPSTGTASFDAQTDLDGVTAFVRDITNLVYRATASSPELSVSWVDSSVVSKVGKAASSDNVQLRDFVDLQAWAQDRILRGENVALRLPSIRLDTVTSTAGAIASVTALIPGDLVTVTNLDSATLGFSSWSGWYLGADELHTPNQDLFTLYLAPVLPATAVYDTGLYGRGAESTPTLNVSINAAVTSVAVFSAIPMATTGFPYTILVDSEQMTVSAATAPAANVQTLTVTRGANGTSAASHSLAALVDVMPIAYYAF